MKVLQANLGRAWAAHDLAYASAAQNEVDILLISEVNKTIARRSDWIVDKREDAGVFCRNKSIGLEGYSKLDGAGPLHFESFDIYSCYISPNISLKCFKDDIDKIMDEIRVRKREAIILGDSKSPAWASPNEDTRGAYITEWMAILDIVALDKGNTPTFVRGESKSFIDVTLATTKIAKHICNWRVSEEKALSLHRYIYFEVNATAVPKKLLSHT